LSFGGIVEMKRITHYIWISTLILTMALSGCGGGNSGGPSNPPPGNPLVAPRNIKVTAADKQLTAEWDAVDGATCYQVWYGTGNSSSSALQSGGDITATSYTITGLDNNQLYYIWIRAKNGSGLSDYSVTVSATPKAPMVAPAAPAAPMLTPGSSCLQVTWLAVTGAISYQVYYATTSSGQKTQFGGDYTVPSCTITGLTNGTAYYVWITAKNSIGTSDYSPSASGTPIPVPAAPAAPTLIAGDRQIIVNWSAVTGATSYQVWYGTSTSSGSASQYGSDITGTTCTITGLSNGIHYYVWVKAKNSSGISGFSPQNSILLDISIGEIIGGTGSYADNDWISFGKTFSKVPVVLVNAHNGSGQPFIAGVRDESGLAPDKTGFTLKLHDLDNNVVTNKSTVQWVAINPAYSSQVEVLAKTVPFCYDGEYIPFDHTLSATYPIVICSAYDNSMAYPLIAAPYSINSNGFTISLKDADGNPSTACMSYIALVPPSNYNYYKEVAMVASYTTYNNNGSVLFSLTRNADAVLCSAQKNNFAYAVAARNNSQYGFYLGLFDYDGAAGTSVWTSWLALGFK